MSLQAHWVIKKIRIHINFYGLNLRIFFYRIFIICCGTWISHIICILLLYKRQYELSELMVLMCTISIFVWYFAFLMIMVDSLASVPVEISSWTIINIKKIFDEKEADFAIIWFLVKTQTVSIFGETNQSFMQTLKVDIFSGSLYFGLIFFFLVCSE